METFFIISTILLICIGLSGLIVSIVLVCRNKKMSKSDDAEILLQLEIMSENMQEIISIVKMNTGEQIKASQDLIISSYSVSNKTMIDLFDSYIKSMTEQSKQNGTDTKKEIAEMRKELNENISSMKSDINRNLAEVRKDNQTNLDQVRKDNQEKLDAIRLTVDEKLSSTLDTRVKNAFEMVSSRLEAVQKGFGEMKDLSSKVGNLNKVFTNVKTRGGWGEVSLETLLEQILSPEQFSKQIKLDKKSKEVVDFAVIMPGQAGETVYLPIDSKFPQEDYDRLVDATELGDLELVKSCKKALVDAVKRQAKSISEKYIIPPITTNFAIMYLPTEGLYAEIVRDSGLCSDLQSKFRITVCGPTTITALLNSLQTGFTTLKIQKRSGEIVTLMNAFRKDFSTFTELIGKVKDKAKGVVNSLDEVDKRNTIIVRKLNKLNDIEELPVIEADAEKIEIDGDETSIDEEGAI